MSNLLNNLQQNSTITNTKGGKYYATSYDSNLDFFAGVSRFYEEKLVERNFASAYVENDKLALANLLYCLDIRNGKGERRIFKICFAWLCNNHPNDARKILYFIPELGRWDYILVGLHTSITDDVLSIIDTQLTKDMASDNPSLLAKWLPSMRTHGKNNPEAKYISRKLGITFKQYRKVLKILRNRIRIVETSLTNKDYDSIDFEKVPTKAMLKYRNTFNSHMHDSFEAYKNAVKSGEKRINTSGLFCYEIVQKIIRSSNWSEWNWTYDESKPLDTSLLNLMWENQKDFLTGNQTNVLVMADTSGSMLEPNCLPIANAIGLAIYTAERNHGFFHDYFMTFSSEPQLQKVTGESITQKVNSIKSIVEETDVDKAFELLLNTAIKNHISNDDMPSHIIIISDMEFDDGCYSNGGTNFSGWKKAFEKAGYILPKIIFWNVATETHGLPVTKNDNNVMMVSGFSTTVLKSILDLENYSPVDSMMEILAPYCQLLEKNIG